MRVPALMLFAVSASVAWAVLPSKKEPKAKAAVEENPAIAKIRAKYESIKKSEPKLVRAELEEAAGKSSEGSSAVAFRERGVVKEVREEYFGEMGRNKYSIFYDKDVAFFVLEEETRYSMPMMTEMEGLPKPMEEQIEHRYYIEGGRLIRWTSGKKEIAPAEDKFKKRESEILDLAADAFENAN